MIFLPAGWFASIVSWPLLTFVVTGIVAALGLHALPPVAAITAPAQAMLEPGAVIPLVAAQGLQDPAIYRVGDQLQRMGQVHGSTVIIAI